MNGDEPIKNEDQEKEIQPQDQGRKGVITDLAELPKEALLDEKAIAKAFGVCARTIRRMVTRYELPPPIRVAGKSMWISGRVLDWFNNEAEKAEKDAKKIIERIRRLSP